MYEPLMCSFLFLYLYRILFTALAPLPVTFLRAAPMKPTFSGISTCWQTSGFRFGHCADFGCESNSLLLHIVTIVTFPCPVCAGAGLGLFVIQFGSHALISTTLARCTATG